jgi:hypothetical protein
LTGKTNVPLCFLDAQGGSLARLGAAVAHALGYADAIAMVRGEEKPLSDDVATVLEEVSMTAPEAMPFDDALTSKYSCVWLGSGPAPVPNARVWTFALPSPDEPQFDRLVTARLVRDRIAQQIRQTSRG